MRAPIVCAGFALAFAAGLSAAQLLSPARAQPAPGIATGIAPGIVNLTAMTDDEIGPLIPGTDLRSRTLVATPNGTVAVQSGNVLKHFHAQTDEIQLILDGTGSFWLGEREVQVRPGDLVVIPRGTHHAGSRAATGRFRALAIKLPPQPAGDTHPVP